MFFWKRNLTKILQKNSQVIETTLGPIEYAIVGSGPVIVGIHGTPGGYDQTICLAEDLARHHFELIGWSRPGYLRTPLSTGKTVEEQADCLYALLDKLKIDKIALLALSGGGPCAIKFALKYPEKLWAIVFESTVSLPLSVNFSLKMRFFLTDFGQWLYHLLIHYFPTYALKQFFFNESRLNKEKIKEKVQKILANPQKMDFFEKLIQTVSPISMRRNGWKNDMKNFLNLENFPLEDILCPTLLVHGLFDKEVPFYHSKHMADRIKYSTLIEMEEGHILNFSENYLTIHNQIIQFFKKSYSKSN